MTATEFLRDHTTQDRGWIDRILHRGGRDPKLDEALNTLLETGDEVLGLIGADRPAPTPYGVDSLEWRIRNANDLETVALAKRESAQALEVIDRLTGRSVPQAFGRFASAISRKHGITAPDWASVQ
jgi:hypothetical protein